MVDAKKIENKVMDAEKKIENAVKKEKNFLVVSLKYSFFFSSLP